MWARFGTPTHAAGSGTEEEFNRAYERWVKTPTELELMFYFKKAPIPPLDIDTDQLARVQAFKDRLNNDSGGLTGEFGTAEEFKQIVRIDLASAVKIFQNPPHSSIDKKVVEPQINSEKISEQPQRPLSNLEALDRTESESGLLDLMETAENAMTEVSGIILSMADANEELNERFREQSSKMRTLDVGTSDRKTAIVLVNQITEHLNSFVDKMAQKLESLHEKNNIAMDCYAKAGLLLREDFSVSEEDVSEAKTGLKSYSLSMVGAKDSVIQFRDEISKLPRLTTQFNRARRRGVAILNDLLSQLDLAINQADSVRKLLS